MSAPEMSRLLARVEQLEEQAMRTAAAKADWCDEPCPTWCDGDHMGEDHPDSQFHSGWVDDISLSLEWFAECERPKLICANPRRYGDGRQFVVLSPEDDEIRFTIDEARRLAVQLLSAAEQADVGST